MNRKMIKQYSKYKVRSHMADIWKCLFSVFLIYVLIALITIVFPIFMFHILSGLYHLNKLFTVGLILFYTGVVMLLIPSLFGLLRIRKYSYLCELVKSRVRDIDYLKAPFWRCFQIGIAVVIITIITIIASLVFLVPGIIIAMGFALTPYLMSCNDSLGIIEAMRKSWNMMYHYKVDLLLLRLSFLGWYLLAPFTAFLLCIWLVPYQKTVVVKFFMSIEIYS